MGLNSENVVEREWLCFDIETVPMPNCGDYLVDPIDAPSNYKDPAKIAAYITEKRQQQIADAGLDLDLCEVVAIGTAWHNGTHSVTGCDTRRERSEADLLRGFWREAAGCRLIGFNIRWFDLPVLLRRSLYLGIPAPAISLDKYRHDGIVDVADTLSFGRRDLLRSLAFYAKRLDLPHDDSVDGSQIASLVAEGKWDVVAAKCRGDVATTVALAQRLGFIPQPQPVESAVA